MASIRRSLSPIPRPGILLNREACSVSSPLSKTSSCTDKDNISDPPSGGGLLSSLFGNVDSQAFVLSVFSTRSSRERSKPMGKLWRRALFHFSICFVVGVFIGITPFVSMNNTSSMNLISKQQALSFEMSRTDIGNVTYGDVVENNVSLDLPPMKLESVDEIFARSSYDNQSFLDLETRKLLIIVTPTYNRPVQADYLKRLAHTLKLVPPPLLWIVVEMVSQSEETADILRKTGVMYRHLVCDTKNLTGVKDRKVDQRNMALSHIEKHHLDGIVYFADDDNIYSADLFKQMREIRRFGTWPVGQLLGDKSRAIWDGPVCNGTEVIGWHLNGLSRRYQRFRRFHAEMSGFAFNSTILWDPKRWRRPTLEPIRQLDTLKDRIQTSAFIEQLVEDENQMEGLLSGCSRILVWHVDLESSDSAYPNNWVLKSNLNAVIPLS
ncbi:probable beta-1,4-xylosyltransferase IRX9H [Rutidosis leptorrhynchoides]|uniref:probable beta-1,4-xylosyltransferase IRX9H n=1 Tax=Rutidosis leptorrhynchoides TaxID=125765 RepID=UPI003A98D427